MAASANVKLEYLKGQGQTKILQDPLEFPVTIIGQLSNLNKVQFDDVKSRFASCVDEKVKNFKSFWFILFIDLVVFFKTWNKGVKSLSPGSNDSVSLYLNKIQVCVLPSKCSRHNAPSRPHALSKIVKSMSSIGNDNDLSNT